MELRLLLTTWQKQKNTAVLLHKVLFLQNSIWFEVISYPVSKLNPATNEKLEIKEAGLGESFSFCPSSIYFISSILLTMTFFSRAEEDGNGTGQVNNSLNCHKMALSTVDWQKSTFDSFYVHFFISSLVYTGKIQ